MKNSTVAVLGAGVLGESEWLEAQGKEASEPAKIKEFRTLGRTGFKVSDISTGGPHNVELLQALLDSGVNYIDTAEGYGRGNSERTVGKAMKNRDRKPVFITTKLGVEKDNTKGNLLDRARKCLERLDTDYIDCLMNHLPENLETLNSEAFHAASSQLKSEGRVRFVGLSHHGSNHRRDPEESMEKILLAAAEDGRYDVMLLAYNFLNEDKGDKVLEVCREKNIGITLMKTNPVGGYYGMKEYVEKAKKEGKEVRESSLNYLERLKKKTERAEGFIKRYGLNNPGEIRDAAIRWALNNTNVHTACISFDTFSDIEEYVRLSGSRFTPVDQAKLTAYAEGCGSLYCRHACGVCESQCPHSVPVNTIMRYHHYFQAQRREKHAMQKYANLAAAKADKCRDCEGHCETSCPYGVPIQGLLNCAHQNLILV